MKVLDNEYGVPMGLKYLFLSTFFYLKCRSYGTLMAGIAVFLHSHFNQRQVLKEQVDIADRKTNGTAPPNYPPAYFLLTKRQGDTIL